MTSHSAEQASLLVLEAGFTLLAGLMAFCWPKAGSRWFAKIEKLADAVPAIMALLDFKLSKTYQDFLNRYVQWRIENPVVK